jgi:hypothetical protein
VIQNAANFLANSSKSLAYPLHRANISSNNCLYVLLMRDICRNRSAHENKMKAKMCQQGQILTSKFLLCKNQGNTETLE